MLILRSEIVMIVLAADDNYSSDVEYPLQPNLSKLAAAK